MAHDNRQDDGAAFDIAADWLSFSLTHPFGGGGEVDHARTVFAVVAENWPELQILDNLQEVSRKPYNAVFKLAIGGQVLFADLVGHILIEIQGAGCRTLEDSGDFYAVATRAIGQSLNITRFDLAVDFETDTDPEVFAKSRGRRWKAFGIMASETGKTAYVGAPKSARRARVYRYSEPHQRAHLLRVEMVMAKPRAAGAVAEYLDKGAAEFAAMAGNVFGWHHPLWSFRSDAKIAAWTPERGRASTLRWIHNAVIPSLAKLYETGVLPNGHSIWSLLAEVTPLLPPDLAENGPPLLIGGSKSFDPPVSNLPLDGF